MNEEQRLKMLLPPEPGAEVLLDTDAFNEIDDPFAIAYLISSPELKPVAICAAPFLNERSVSPEDGMEKSYAEIQKVLRLAGREDLLSCVCRGAGRFLDAGGGPVECDATERIIREALRHDTKNPLYVVSIGAATNTASALLLCPEIRERMTVVWLGGNASFWRDAREFNLMQDRRAACILAESGVPFVRLPCLGTVDRFYSTEPELKHWLSGRNPLADYLAQNAIAAANSYAEGKPWSRVIWDVTAVAWLKNRGERFLFSSLGPAQTVSEDYRMIPFAGAQTMRTVTYVRRDELMEDLFRLLM